MSGEPPNKKKSFGNKRHFGKGNYRRNFIEPGIKGFLATCNFRERDCVKESYNILNEYADLLYGPTENKSVIKSDAEADLKNPFDDKKEDPAVAGADKKESCIEDELQKALEDVRQTGKKGGNSNRFNSVETGATNCVFIKTSLPDPVELVFTIVKDIFMTKTNKTRFLLRLVPIEAVCRANMTDIINAAGPLFDKYFLENEKTFSIIFNKRCNNELDRDNVIKELADLVSSKNIKNSVHLNNPDVSVIVEVIKGLCCLSVVPQYIQMKKYNLAELCKSIKHEEDDNNIVKPSLDATTIVPSVKEEETEK